MRSAAAHSASRLPGLAHFSNTSDPWVPYNYDMSLDGGVAIVTGATRGVGRGIVREVNAIDILVNNVWGGYERMVDGNFTWPKPFCEQPLWRWDAMFGRSCAIPDDCPAAGLIVNISFWAAQKHSEAPDAGRAHFAEMVRHVKEFNGTDTVPFCDHWDHHEKRPLPRAPHLVRAPRRPSALSIQGMRRRCGWYRRLLVLGRPM